MCSINPKFSKEFKLTVYTAHGSLDEFENDVKEQIEFLLKTEQELNKSGKLRWILDGGGEINEHKVYSVIFKHDVGPSFNVIATGFKSIIAAKNARQASGDYVAEGSFAIGSHLSTPPSPVKDERWLFKHEIENKNSYAYKLVHQ